ncbi:hypothetical protein GDO81_011974 [Engystomops pustulosus]|uniref:ATP synthase F0 subunit 8 n=1 Tax=Engystomops pustulosus TaxID=76066 RepID=A0AAV7BHW6_ENGPU|nr:hypothetical protein GDO81_011974 [Engystomops pustulosus]
MAISLIVSWQIFCLFSLFNSVSLVLISCSFMLFCFLLCVEMFIKCPLIKTLKEHHRLLVVESELSLRLRYSSIFASVSSANWGRFMT